LSGYGVVMLESTASLRLQPPDALAGALIGLITDLRKVINHPEMGPVAKLAEVFAIVDKAAPYPAPEDSLPVRGPAG
jgi:hypothetical protein